MPACLGDHSGHGWRGREEEKGTRRAIACVDGEERRRVEELSMMRGLASAAFDRRSIAHNQAYVPIPVTPQRPNQSQKPMVFAKQYTRKDLAITAPTAGPREVASRSSTRVFASLMGIDGLFDNHISPALATRELLRLSATCKELQNPARALVTEVCIRRDIVRRSAVPRAVRVGLPLLPGLRVLDLSFVSLGPRDYTAMASALLSPETRTNARLKAFRVRQRAGYSPGPIPQESDLCLLRFFQGVVTTQAWPVLEDLDLSGHCIGDAAVELLVSWMEGTAGGDSSSNSSSSGQGQQRRLKRLGLSTINMSEKGLMHLLRPLAKGRCPVLLRMDLSGNACGSSGDGGGGGGGGVMEGGGGVGEGTKRKYKEALWTAALCGMPHLLELDLNESGVEGEVTLALARSLLKGAGRKMKRLSLGGCSLTDQDTRNLWEVVREGGMPWLQDLNLRQACLEREGFMGVAAGLEGGHLRYLRRLDLSENLLTYEGMQDIVRALQKGAAPQIRSLRLGSTGHEFEEVNEMVVLWCAKLKNDGYCPQLVLRGKEEGKGGEGGGGVVSMEVEKGKEEEEEKERVAEEEEEEKKEK